MSRLILENKKKLPSGWDLATINDIVGPDGIFIDGDWVESKDQDPNGDVRLIQLADIGVGNFRNKSNRFMTIKKAESLNCTILEQGDILIARMPEPLGRSCIFPGDVKPCVTIVDVAIVRPGKLGVYPKWLMYLINSPQINSLIESLELGTTRKRISRKNLSKIPFPIPPINEQKRIVEKIEELFPLIFVTVDSLKKIRHQLEQYKISLFISAYSGKLTESWRKKHSGFNVENLMKNIEKQREKEKKKKFKITKQHGLYSIPTNWKWVTIGEIEKFVGSGITPRGGKSNYHDSGIPFIRSQNVYQEGLRMDEIAHITKKQHLKMSRTHIQDGDVLLNITGASIGRSTCIPEGFGEGNVNQHVCIMRFYSGIYSQIVSYWFNSSEGQRQIFSTQTGQTREGLNYSHVRSISIPLCSPEEQQEITNELEKNLTNIFVIEKEVEERLLNLNELKKSILKTTFEGKLIPQDQNDEPASVLLTKIKNEKLQKEKKATIKIKTSKSRKKN